MKEFLKVWLFIAGGIISLWVITIISVELIEIIFSYSETLGSALMFLFLTAALSMILCYVDPY